MFAQAYFSDMIPNHRRTAVWENGFQWSANAKRGPESISFQGFFISFLHFPLLILNWLHTIFSEDVMYSGQKPLRVAQPSKEAVRDLIRIDAREHKPLRTQEQWRIFWDAERTRQQAMS